MTTRWSPSHRLIAPAQPLKSSVRPLSGFFEAGQKQNRPSLVNLRMAGGFDAIQAAKVLYMDHYDRGKFRQ